MDEFQVETALRMTNDRNMVSHAYIEAIADIIFSRIPEYARIIEAV